MINASRVLVSATQKVGNLSFSRAVQPIAVGSTLRTVQTPRSSLARPPQIAFHAQATAAPISPVTVVNVSINVTVATTSPGDTGPSVFVFQLDGNGTSEEHKRAFANILTEVARMLYVEGAN